MKHALITLYLVAPSLLFCQLEVDNVQTVEWYVQNVLLGGGVTATNVTFNGAPANQVELQCGYFNSANANVGLGEGMILASGDIQDALGPNNNPNSGQDLGQAGDADLDIISSFGTYDAAILEFDFVPQGDSLSFNYVFGSDEYPEFANGSYNDIFGFFLAGPGLNGPYTSPAGFPNGSVNIAVIPGTNIPVAINDINNGQANTGPCENCAYYVENGDGNTAPYSTDPEYIQYDGLTVPLRAFSVVECGETYHIKIVIADAGDGIYDSGVFLEAGSFSSNQQVQIDLEFDINNTFTTNTLFEGCFTGELVFSRFSNITDVSTIELMISGSATNGTDYTEIPELLTFQAGDSTISLNIEAYIDGLAEGTETVTLQVVNNTNLCQSNTPQEFTFYIADSAPPLILDGQDFSIDCNESVDLSAIASGGFGLYEYAWDNGTTGNSQTVAPDVTTDYFLTVSDTCVAQTTTAQFTVDVASYDPIEVVLPDDFTMDCDDYVATINPLTVSGGSSPLEYEWEINWSFAGNGTNLEIDLNTSSTISLTITDQCGSTNESSLFANVIPYTYPMVTLSPQFLTDCLDPLAVVAPTSVSGGQGLLEYTWTTNGTVTSTDTEIEVLTTEDENLFDIELSIVDECGFSTTAVTSVNYQDNTPINIQLPPTLELICDNPEVSITPTAVSGGMGDLNYSWTADGLVITDEYELFTATEVPVQYTFTVLDECGYESSESVDVDILPYTYPSILTQGDTMICAGEPVQLHSEMQAGMEPYSYVWNHSTANANEVQANPTASSTFNVIGQDACGNTDIGYIQVAVTSVDAGFNLNMQPFHGFKTVNTSTSELSSIIEYSWFIDGEFFDKNFEIEHQFDDMDDHVVSLLMVNEAGCKDSAWTSTEAPPTLFVPSAFTPDSDGLNDVFFVRGNNLTKYSISIFDKWGNVIFESVDINEPWTGNGQEGSDFYAPADIYHFKVIAEGPGGHYFDYKGHITLIR